MEKTSKILLAILLVLVLVLSAACTNTEGSLKQPSDVNGDSNVESGNSTDGNEEDVAPDNGDGTDDTQNDADMEITVEETVLYETDEIKVTATGYEVGWMGPEINVLIENSYDVDVMVFAEAVSVNGYMMPYASLYADVAAGKKANESIYLMSGDLERCGIETVGQIQFYIEVSDSETWDTLAVSNLITLTTSAGAVSAPEQTGDAIYEDNGIAISCLGLKDDDVWDGSLVFFMKNESGQPITIYAEDVSVNGFMAETGMWSDLRDGTMLVDGMILMDLEDLELDSVDGVEEIEFKLRIINEETWDEIDTTEIITLTFE